VEAETGLTRAFSQMSPLLPTELTTLASGQSLDVLMPGSWAPAMYLQGAAYEVILRTRSSVLLPGGAHRPGHSQSGIANPCATVQEVGWATLGSD